jgi:hypothetical protein
MPEYTDPSNTLALLDKLEAMGFSDRAFSILHHFEKPEGIASHRRYCETLREEGAHFRTPTNQLVQKRLSILARIYEAGPFESKSSAVFERLAEAILLEVPHDRRPLAEQVRSAGHKSTAS